VSIVKRARANSHFLNNNSLGKTLRVGLFALALCKKNKGAQTNAPIPFAKTPPLSGQTYTLLR